MSDSLYGRNKNLWKRFISNPFTLMSLIYISLVFILSVFSYFIIPDDSENANTQHLEIATQKPGFRVKIITRRLNREIKERSFGEVLFKGRNKNTQEYPYSSCSISGDSIYIFGFGEDGYDYRFSLADMLYPVDPSRGYLVEGDSCIFYDKDIKSLRSESLEDMSLMIGLELTASRLYVLGTDRFGRDLLSRLILGGRVSLSVGFIAVIISLFLGVIVGALAGYYGGWIDRVLMWFINVIWSVPTLLMVIALTMVLGKGFWQIFVAVGLTMWVEVARVVRGEVMSQRKLEYVDVARVSGYSNRRILFRHILPNISSPVIIIAASNFATAILLEAGLSFLGTGIQPPVPSWGVMIRDHYGYIIVDKAFLAFVPGVAIMLLVLSFTLAGNGLRDVLDVKRR